MITALSNISFNRPFITGINKNIMPQRPDSFIMSSCEDTVNTFSGNFRKLSEETSALNPGFIDSLIKQKRSEIKELNDRMEYIESIHESLHGWNTVYLGGEELYANHVEILKIRKKIEQLESEIKHLFFQKFSQQISPVPEDVAKYFHTVSFPVTQSGLKKTGTYYNKLASDDDAVKIRGNNLVTLENEEIWKEMNRLLDIKPGTPPQEIDIQYYLLEDSRIYEKIGKAARAGHKIRVIVNPGEGFIYERFGDADASSFYRCLKTIEALLKETDGTDCGICVTEKNDITDLAHRKLLRAGEKVLISGMNVEERSGENIDYGMVIEGPAAKIITEKFAKDVKVSSGKSMEEVLGKEDFEVLTTGFKTTGSKKERCNIFLSSEGFRHFLTSLLPPESQAYIESAENTPDKVIRIIEELKKYGPSIDDIVTLYGYSGLNEAKFQANLMSDDPEITFRLKDGGRKRIADRFQQCFQQLTSEKNLTCLKDIKLPEGKNTGVHTLTVASSQAEIQGIVLHAINSAEEFLYGPFSSLSKDMAKLIIDKKKIMDQQGKKFDVRIVLEPSESNMEACMLLEDAGIPVHWAILNGAEPACDRKVHSQMIVTDRVLVTGNTNLNDRGLNKNLGTSVMASVEPEIAETVERRDEYKKSFIELWEKESLKFNSSYTGYNPEYGEPLTNEERRKELIGEVFKLIERNEKNYGAIVNNIVETRKDIREEIERLKNEGFHEGSARLSALKKFYSERDMEAFKLKAEKPSLVYGNITIE